MDSQPEVRGSGAATTSRVARAAGDGGLDGLPAAVDDLAAEARGELPRVVERAVANERRRGVNQHAAEHGVDRTRRIGPHDQQRPVYLAQHALGHRAQPPALRPLAAVRAHHDEIRRHRLAHDRVARRALVHDGRQRMGRVPLTELRQVAFGLRPHRLSLALEHLDLLVREVGRRFRGFRMEQPERRGSAAVSDKASECNRARGRVAEVDGDEHGLRETRHTNLSGCRARIRGNPRLTAMGQVVGDRHGHPRQQQ